MNIAREFVGGPFDRELLAVNDNAQIVRVPLPRHWRKNLGKPETASYQLEEDEMHFVSRSVASNLVRPIATVETGARNAWCMHS